MWLQENILMINGDLIPRFLSVFNNFTNNFSKMLGLIF